MNIDAPRHEDVPALRVLWKQAFGDTDAFLDSFFETAFSFDRCRLVKIDHTVVAALYWFGCSCENRRLAYLYAVATDMAYRGRGICHKLMEDTHNRLAALGYDGVILVPGSETLFRFYGSLGYEICSYIREFTCFAVEGAHPPFRSVDIDEYARLRRLYLPAGGVIQEKENLVFLGSQVKFYSGDGFLLAVCERNGQLFVPEVLGDISKLPEIVHALGYEKGIFRSPGEDMPFAMYRLLTEDSAFAPSYFGFAFDV